MSRVEIVIQISLDADPRPDALGISANAEPIVDECFYVDAPDVDSALCGAEAALKGAGIMCAGRAKASRPRPVVEAVKK